MHQSYVDTESVAFEANKHGRTRPSMLIFMLHIFTVARWKTFPALRNQKHLGLCHGNPDTDAGKFITKNVKVLKLWQ